MANTVFGPERATKYDPRHISFFEIWNIMPNFINLSNWVRVYIIGAEHKNYHICTPAKFLVKHTDSIEIKTV